ncbi:RrF2 family transcriptional regulator [Aequorivita marina]|uniref:RrF2 family transcriptional regulator n=1 Tax=Aequorivita marina TaxID=3073654 RepID=UPI0028749473|nr:Rrf2 family transcriptional regulator [Aequorivita sp. S2608]MDS1299169.1 Rrf2 family transcriptional regulator [Aequorivita sp. S2608]
MISKSCKYAIRATVFIASKAKEKIKVGVKEIAEEIEAPEAFTGKILQALNKSKIVTSVKGPYGGFYCDETQLSLPIIDVVSAIDGTGVFTDCVFGLHQCSDDHPCPMHFEYSKTRDKMHNSFKNTTIKSLAENLSTGIAFLKNPQ